ncbi:MAG: magnesium chelatase subunit D [Pseudomonadota bacterium]
MRDLADDSAAPEGAGPGSPPPGQEAWPSAILAATLLAVAPHALGGAVLRARAGPARETWLDAFAALLPEASPWRRLPAGTDPGRLVGGLDLAATLAEGRPVAERGLLHAADGGAIVLPGAERAGRGLAGALGRALDRGRVPAPLADPGEAALPARIAVIALDEGVEADETAPAALTDRLAFRAALDGVALADLTPPVAGRAEIAAARARFPEVTADEVAIAALVGGAAALGIHSLRAPLLALAAARAHAALEGRDAVEEPDLALAAQLVLAPRATCLPAAEAPEEPETPPDTPPPDEPDPSEAEAAERREALEDMLLAAAAAALPDALLARLADRAPARGAAPSGAAGADRIALDRGRPVGLRPGRLAAGARLALVETLTAAAPWQPLRRAAAPGARRGRLQIRQSDFRIRRFRAPRETLTIFAVDASGSAALARLAEAKGAVELMLAEAYRRRDQVALVAFRREAAELLLPPTRALARARRALAGLPGGGGTPLAAGIDAAAALATEARRRGQSAAVVVLTDGKANIARDGTPGRAQARADAEAAAQRLAATGAACLVIDTAARPGPAGRALAEAMQAEFLALPGADARRVAAAASTLAGARK